MSTKPTIFIIGAHGFIGKPLSMLLAMNGLRVMGLARTQAEKARLLAQDGVEPVLGALDKPEDFTHALAEADFLIDVSLRTTRIVLDTPSWWKPRRTRGTTLGKLRESLRATLCIPAGQESMAICTKSSRGA
jgi:nucleoside-diphosphate-sugar epimerase